MQVVIHVYNSIVTGMSIKIGSGSLTTTGTIMPGGSNTTLSGPTGTAVVGWFQGNAVAGNKGAVIDLQPVWIEPWW